MLTAYDQIDNIIDLYTRNGVVLHENKNFENYQENRSGSGEMIFTWAKLLDEKGNLCHDFFIGDAFELQFSVNNRQKMKSASIGIQIRGVDDVPLLHMMNQDANFKLLLDKQEESFKVILKDLSLFPGEYTITLTVADTGGHTVYDNLESCLGFTVLEGGARTNRKLPKEAGRFFIVPEWEKIS